MFYDDIVKQFVYYSTHQVPLRYTDSSNTPPRVIYASLLKDLEDEKTKRFIFDARQAKLFGDIDEEPDGNMLQKIRPPFPQFYCEFTEPILVGEQEPGIEGIDYLRSFFYRQGALEAEIMIPGDEQKHSFMLDHCSVFLINSNGDYVDRSFKFILPIGRAAVTKRSALASQNPTIFENGIIQNMGDDAYFLSGYGLEREEDITLTWQCGWWEKIAQQYASLVMWIMAYMMAKSINIHEIPLSRQQRRWHEAHRITPRPWHRVELKPKFSRYTPSEGEAQYHHNYRYDVVGHLRFNRHKRNDGSYNETIEWVPSHQRGLAHETYIPKLYEVKSRKKIDPSMRSYFGKDIKT